ncbi:E3 ubiquitin-protein ligase makorin-1 [Dermatophagoides farinae]|uniref:E3 ubiquitin-protein ligase makorin-1 n=1 Tax=Dermatophagoides farinae TaxID=6954 RepID=A0A922I2H3_DERFA|nr:E3 ubiquitin-protein ligase makorin-1 [Dermatophagoides farinae]
MDQKSKSDSKNVNRVAICECLGKLPVNVPLETDGTLLVSVLSAFFPGAVNIQYMIGVSQWRTPQIIDGRIQEPPFDLGGWKCCKYFYCIMIRKQLSDFDAIKHYDSLCARNLCQTYVRDGFCMQQIQQNCYFVHGDFCDDCQLYTLHPFNADLRQKHEIDCLAKKMKNQKIDIENCPENNDPSGIYEKLISGSICPRYERYGQCNGQEKQNCHLIHGDLCDICGYYSLHPFCELDREKHTKKCIEELEMKNTCSICLEIIGQTPVSDRNNGDNNECQRSFGRLKNCFHTFCFNCIQTWRTKSNSMECPICRVPSESVIKTND